MACNPALTNSLYNHMFWYCSCCCSDASASHSVVTAPLFGVIQCVLMNVHNIIGKRLNLCAYLVTNQIDIFTITETFSR